MSDRPASPACPGRLCSPGSSLWLRLGLCWKAVDAPAFEGGVAGASGHQPEPKTIGVKNRRSAEAKEAARSLMSFYPHFSISAWRLRAPHRPAIIDRHVQIYRAAGLPE